MRLFKSALRKRIEAKILELEANVDCMINEQIAHLEYKDLEKYCALSVRIADTKAKIKLLEELL